MSWTINLKVCEIRQSNLEGITIYKEERSVKYKRKARELDGTGLWKQILTIITRAKTLGRGWGESIPNRFEDLNIETSAQFQ